ncbi:Chitin synthase, class 2 [Ceratobasidium sp. UAMH 11750]|nr:Chitin synthase, class 2 [Ceratobasidium sp. UAMH 11750]
MPYTAATCNPDDFSTSRYSLRSHLMNCHTELFMATTNNVQRGQCYIRQDNQCCHQERHQSLPVHEEPDWGTRGLEKAFSNSHNRTLNILQLMGCHQDGIAKDEVAGKDVTAQIFEYTSTVVSGTGGVAPGSTPVQILFCLKNRTRGLPKLRGETMHGESGGNSAGLFERNMYLSEDRVLCFETDEEERGVDAEIPQECESVNRGAYDGARNPLLPHTASNPRRLQLAEFISQRPTLAQWFILCHIPRDDVPIPYLDVGQGFLRKIVLQFEFWYDAVQMLSAWASLEIFCLAFISATSSVEQDAFNFSNRGTGTTVFEVMLKLYIAILFVILIYLLGNLHDLDWVPRGENRAAKDLGGAKKVKGDTSAEMAEVEVPTAKEEIDSMWAASWNVLRQRSAELKDIATPA